MVCDKALSNPQLMGQSINRILKYKWNTPLGRQYVHTEYLAQMEEQSDDNTKLQGPIHGRTILSFEVDQGRDYTLTLILEGNMSQQTYTQ